MLKRAFKQPEFLPVVLFGICGVSSISVNASLRVPNGILKVLSLRILGPASFGIFISMIAGKKKNINIIVDAAAK